MWPFKAKRPARQPRRPREPKPTVDATIIALRDEIAYLTQQLRLRDAEIESLAGIIARDRKRVEAEIAIAAKTIAESTNGKCS